MAFYDCVRTLFSELCSQSITPTNNTHTSTFLQNYTCTVEELDKDISIAEVEYAIKLLIRVWQINRIC